MKNLSQKSADLLVLLRKKNPLVHHITNFVVMNDTANITLCIGGLPVMAHSKKEVEEMVDIANALVLNPGTLEDYWIEAMLLAGKKANKKNIPIILDPVGAGATTYRTTTNKQFLEELKISVLRGNAGEIATLAGVKSEVKGVESREVNAEITNICKDIAQKYNLIAVVTGKDDFISDGNITYKVSNGHAWLKTLTGTGCMATAVIGTFASVSDNKNFAAASALSCYGIAAELASKNVQGPASFKTAFFDQIYNLTPEKIIEYAKIIKL